MARLLIVEDEEDFFQSIRQACLEADAACEITWAKSRDAALLRASESFFDLAVLDQKIPTIDDALDAHVDHGRAVWDELFASSPGMPILILTALSADDIISTVVRRCKNQRIWGGNSNFPSVDHLGKKHFDQFPDRIAGYTAAIGALRDVEVLTADDTQLDEQERRLCQVFVSRSRGVRCEVRTLSGGLSGSPVYHLYVFDENGQKIQNAVLKVGTKEMVELENENLHLINRLPASASPRLLETLYFGGKNLAAIAYQLADGCNRNIFDLVREQPADLAAAIVGITERRRPWIEAKSEQRMTISDIRRTVLKDEAATHLAEEYGLDWLDGFEARNVQVNWGCIHGDLHGENILLDEGSAPVFIDYGDVREGPLALDWMTLECSALFHPGAPAFDLDPCDRVTPSCWQNPSTYSSLPNLQAFFGLCRASAANEGLRHRELVAAAYSYVLRQLKYQDTDKGLALLLLQELRQKFDE
jgi:CheY-like chemotaxis protein